MRIRKSKAETRKSEVRLIHGNKMASHGFMGSSLSYPESRKRDLCPSKDSFDPGSRMIGSQTLRNGYVYGRYGRVRGDEWYMGWIVCGQGG